VRLQGEAANKVTAGHHDHVGGAGGVMIEVLRRFREDGGAMGRRSVRTSAPRMFEFFRVDLV
jgi:hypothetical protein